MPKFVLNRNYTLSSLFGHVVNFKKGEETWVPDILVKECVAIGANPVDGIVDVLGPEEVAVAPLTGEERREKVFQAFSQMLAENRREDFTGAGAPQLPSIEKLSGIKLDGKERDSLWQRYRESLVTEE